MKAKVIILVLLFTFLLTIGLDKLGIDSDKFVGGVVVVGIILFMNIYMGSLLLEDYRKDCKGRTKVKNILNLLTKLLFFIVMNYMLFLHDLRSWFE
jgi:hypothetical protein